jgi:hypothetical protein
MHSSLFARLVLGAAVLVGSFASSLWLIDNWRQLATASSDAPQDANHGFIVDTGADKDDLGWPNCTMRVFIPGSAISGGGRGVSVKFGAGPSRGLHVVEAFIGSAQQGSRLNSNFESSPKQLLFGGAKSVQIPPRTSRASDWLEDFIVEGGKPILISFYLDDKGDDPVAKPAVSGWSSHFKCDGKCVSQCASESEAGEIQVANFEDRSSKFVSHGVAEIRVGKPN